MKVKPQLYQTAVSNQLKKKMTIVMEGGLIQDIVKENISDVLIEVHDYDVDGIDPSTLKKDNNNKQFHKTTLD